MLAKVVDIVNYNYAVLYLSKPWKVQQRHREPFWERETEQVSGFEFWTELEPHFTCTSVSYSVTTEPFKMKFGWR